MPDSNPATPMPKTHAVQCREEGRPQDWWLFKAMTPEPEPVCAHCGTGPHPNPLWRNSRASLDEYRTTDTVCNEFSGDVWLHANCIAEYMREHPALALSIPT